jgi:kynurenine formamidase
MPASASPPPPDRGNEPVPARGATPGQPSRSPWGPDDQIGMLNSVTPASVAGVLSEVDAHKVFDLAVDYFVGMPAWTDWGDPPFTFWMTATPSGGVVDDVAGMGVETMQRVSRSSDAMTMFTHTGTHIDTLNHFGYDGVVWNCHDMREHLGSQHWKVCGADRHPPVISRGVLVDVAGAHGVDVLPDFYGITAEEIQSVLRSQRTELRHGDVVLINTGRMTVWPDAAKFIPDEPGPTLDGVRFLAEAGAIMIGADNIGFEVDPSSDDGSFQPAHTYLLAEAGVPIIEMVELRELARERVYEFAFIGAALKVRGATGAPIRPVALPLRP